MNIINAVSGTGITQTADGSGLIKVQSNGVTTNALAWVNFVGSSASVNSSYNVSSVTRQSAGNYTITFANSQSSASYVVTGSADGNSLGVTTYTSFNALSTSNFTMKTANSANTATDYVAAFAVVFGN